jgi:torulene dioxygenase
VVGEIPLWAAGSLFRAGPGQSQVEDTPKGTVEIRHWFDGLAHSHRFDIVAASATSITSASESSSEPPPQDVRVFYSSRRQSEFLAADMRKHGIRRNMSFAQRRDPCMGIFGKLMSCYRMKSPTEEMRQLENVSVAMHPNPPTNAIDVPVEQPSSPLAKVGSKKELGKATGHQKRQPWITTDTSSILQFDASTLEPTGRLKQSTLHPQLNGPLSLAHAQRCPESGDLYNINVSMGKAGVFTVFRIKASTGETDILASITRADLPPAYMHSFFLTESFVIVCVPSTHLAIGGLKTLWVGNIIDAIEPFDDQKSCRWFVVDRRGMQGVVAEFESPAGFFFHSVNAFEQVQADTVSSTDSEDIASGKAGSLDVFCDMVAYPDFEVMNGLYYDVLMNRDNAAAKFWTEKRAKQYAQSLTRFRLPVSRPVSTVQPTSNGLHVRQAEVILTIPGPHIGELSTINPAYATKKHRYVYSLCQRGLSTLADTLVKTDLETREALMWNSPHGHSPGEAIFVARPRGNSSGASTEDGYAAEDDGVLLSVVLDGNKGTSYLLCLDATRMVELGRAEVGFAIGFGFHGVHTTEYSG